MAYQPRDWRLRYRIPLVVVRWLIRLRLPSFLRLHRMHGWLVDRHFRQGNHQH